MEVISIANRKGGIGKKLELDYVVIDHPPQINEAALQGVVASYEVQLEKTQQEKCHSKRDCRESFS